MTTVVACPTCQQNLQVPDEQLGQAVRGPGCAQVFTPANTAVRSAVPPPLPGEVPVWERPPEEDLARPLDEDEVAEVEGEAGERRKRKKARRRDASESGYYGELQRKQRKMQSPHRGVLVLTLGILSILFSPACLLALGACACGWYAYQMGSHDLQEIYAGRMDRSGQGLAKVGRILGIVGICLSGPVILLSLCGMVGMLVRVAVGPPGPG